MDFTTRFYPATHVALLGDFATQFRSYCNEPDVVELHKMYATFGDNLFLSLLPAMGKAMEVALISCARLEVPSEFSLDNGSQLPILLNYFWRKVFTRDGYPYHDVRDIGNSPLVEEAGHAVKVLRQFTLLFSKVEDVEPQVESADEIRRFVQRVTQDVTITASARLLSLVKGIIAKVVLAEGESQDDPDALLAAPLQQWLEMPWGRHGPGAVAGMEKGVDKWRFSFVEGLDSRLYGYYPEIFGGLRGQPRRGSRVSRLCLVPKDYRGRRIICIEPKELQFAQQGLMQTLYDHVHRHFLTGRSINFLDQRPSQRAAKRGHISTIDLKDASDLVSIGLCRIIFPAPFFRLMTHWRANGIALPDGSSVHTKALATMGSALCFPCETLVFWAISLASIMLREGICLPALDDPAWFERHQGMFDIRVFGDDITVPTEYAGLVCNALQHCGLKVNIQKTCISSVVREACGAWFYGQVDCRVVRLKLTRCRTVLDWISIAESAKTLVKENQLQTAFLLLGRLNGICPVPYGVLGFPDRDDAEVTRHRNSYHVVDTVNDNVYYVNDGYRWNCNLQRLEVLVPTVKTRRGRHLTGYLGLYAWFTGQATESMALDDFTVEMAWTPTSIG